MLDMKEDLAMEASGENLTLEDARQTLEAAWETEKRAYQGLGRAAALTGRQKGVMELIRLEEIDTPDREQLDRKCRLILESYYLPHILKDGFTVKLDEEFTRSEDPGRDYIGVVFTAPSGKEREAGYNYKTDEDGKNLLIFEKTFESVILKPGDPEKYVLYDADGTTELESFSMEELRQRIFAGEVVKVEEGYFLKAKNRDGEILKGDTTAIVEEESDSNVKTLMGNNEQEKFSISKTGQLVCATTNDVTTVTVETRKFASEGPIYDSADAARAAAEKEIHEGETNPRVDVTMEGTTVAEFSYIPTFTTNVELAGISKKIGKGIEGYDPSVSDEENLRRHFAKPISEYLDEKGFYVLDITCENLEADVSENVGFMNTIKTYQMTGGVVSVTYTKKFTSTVTLKQKFLGRGQGNDAAAVLAQLPEGSELLNPQDIDWKSTKPEVTYITRGKITGVGSAKTVPEADEKAANNAIAEAQKVVVRSINGGIASGIREAMSGRGAASTLANVRARIDTPVVSANDMELTHKDNKYAYSGSCDRLVSSVENKLVSVTTWSGKLLTYVEPTDPIIDKGIPTDENYDRYVNEGDDMSILLFEKDDRGLRRYMDDVQDAQNQAKHARAFYEKARIKLREAQETFDCIFDAQVGTLDDADVSEMTVAEEESVVPETAVTGEESIEPATEPVVPEMPVGTEEVQLSAHDALLAIFGEENTSEAEMPAEQPQITGEQEAVEEPEEPQTVGEAPLSAHDALLAIFGEESTSETEVAAEPVVTSETGMTTNQPQMTGEPEETEASNEPETAPAEVDVDAAWEKLLMGMPSEE